MNISYRRTGGFAGMVMSFDIATDKLPSEEAQELHDLVEVAGFFELPAEIESPVPGADQFEYLLTVESNEQQHTVKVGDAAVPENLWPLIDKIRVLWRSNRNV